MSDPRPPGPPAVPSSGLPREVVSADRPPGHRPTVLIGLLGTVLDRGGKRRWERWRPTLSACMQPTRPIDRLELLVQEQYQGFARALALDVARVSPGTEVRLHVVELDDPWDVEDVYARLHDFARAYPFSPEDEDYLVHITTGTHVAQICLFLLTEARFLPARLLQTGRSSPRDALGFARLIDLDLSRYDRIARRFADARQDRASQLRGGIATRNAVYNEMIDEIEHVAGASRAPMLLLGATGAGKSALARRVYQLKKARGLVSGPLVEVNCATLRGDSAMAALFGHTRGAFTGAVQARPGLLRTAHQGVLFLDEVGELGLDEQAMLLRALELRRFLPVGSDKEVESDFQLIAGTNRPLGAQVESGRFRADLLARIDTWSWRLPSLRERAEDIGPNLEVELDRFASQEGRRVGFSREARGRYLAFATSPEATWDRNFRDLGASVRRMATLAPGGRITGKEVEAELGRLRRTWAELAGSPTTVAALPGAGSAPSPAATASDSSDPVAADRALLLPLLGPEGLDSLDLIDVVQLACAVRVCRSSSSMAEAGRTLFAASRARRASTNDSDRVRKLLARHGLSWSEL